MRLLAALVAVSFVAAGSAAAADAPGPVTGVPSVEQQTVAAINAFRRKNGLVALTVNASLTAVSRGHSRSMAEHGFFRHESLDGSSYAARIKAVYGPRAVHRWAIAENIVWASPALNAARALELWLKSPPHRKNILTPAFREIGIGGVHAVRAPGEFGGNDVTILTAAFGVR